MHALLNAYWQGLSHFLFPFQCLGCGHSLDEGEEEVCRSCLSELPLTHYWKDPSNEVAQMFWGKVDLESASSFLFFYQGGKVQKMLHALKYQGRTVPGRILGEQFGEVLRASPYAECDLIVPVPLHIKKEKKRGYNQCSIIGKALAEQLKVGFNDEVLIRTEHHASQTKKGRFDRWLNVRSRFAVVSDEDLIGKHVLLIDDVITTGATLEACAQTLLQIDGVKVSVATVACPAPF